MFMFFANGIAHCPYVVFNGKRDERPHLYGVPAEYLFGAYSSIHTKAKIMSESII